MKKKKNLTYGRLDGMLRGMGFQSRVVESEFPAKVYEHAATGASLAFPVLGNAKQVYSHHLLAVRSTLNFYGIASPDELAIELQRAS